MYWFFFSFRSIIGHQEDSAGSCSPSSTILANNFWHLVASTASNSFMFSTFGDNLDFLIHYTCWYHHHLNCAITTVSSFICYTDSIQTIYHQWSVFETSNTLPVLCFLSVQFSKLMLHSCKISGWVFFPSQTKAFMEHMDWFRHNIDLFCVVCPAGKVSMLTGCNMRKQTTGF